MLVYLPALYLHCLWLLILSASDEEQSELELDLKLGDNLCRSKAFLEHMTPRCSMHSGNNDDKTMATVCAYSDDDDVDTSEASCR